MSAAATASPPEPAPRTALDAPPPRVVPGGKDHAPYIPLPADRAEAVSDLLTAAGVRNWIQLPFPSMDGTWKRKVLLTYAADVPEVQRILDEAAGR